ncbi:MAG TPA: ATP-binding protein [Prosthecobacter sp.]
MQSPPPPEDKARHGWRAWLGLSETWAGGALSARILLFLRWLAVLGQSITLLTVWRAGVEIPWWQCGIAVGLTAITNVLLEWWMRQIRWEVDEGVFHVMLWDTLTLTFLLHWTGGLANPFTLFYLVQLTLAAVALRTSAVVGLGVVTTAALVWLWHHSRPLHMRDGGPVDAELHTMGFLTALVLACAFVLALLLSLRRRSRSLQMERERLRTELDARQRFLSVAALATGFAHELGTPLGTIVLAAAEMQSHPDAETAQIISREAERCQKVLQRLRELGQEAVNSAAVPCSVAEVVEDCLAELEETRRQRVKISQRTAKDAAIACAGIREALLVLLRNAFLASSEDGWVELHVEQQGNRLHFVVRDSGSGFSTEMLRHWGEPFRTTREKDGGIGLGLFFVRRLAESMHGGMKAENDPAGGARVTLVLPCVPRTPFS